MADAFNRCGTYNNRKRRQVDFYAQQSEEEFGRSIDRKVSKIQGSFFLKMRVSDN